MATQGTSLTPGQPVALFQVSIAQYDVSRDGRFPVNVDLADAMTAPLTLLMNWKQLK